MQNPHDIISDYSSNGKLRCVARDISPGKLWIIIHDFSLAQKLEAEGHKSISSHFGEADGLT